MHTNCERKCKIQMLQSGMVHFLQEFKSCVLCFYLRNHVPVLHIVVQHVLVVCLLAVDNLLCIYNTMYMYGFMYL